MYRERFRETDCRAGTTGRKYCPGKSSGPLHSEAIPIAKARGIIQMTMSGPERISGIAIISKIPVIFSRVMVAPAILATLHEFADYYRKEIAVARVLLWDSPVIVFDEFTRSIDEESKRSIYTVTRQLAGKTVIIVAHNMADIEEGINGVHLAKVQ